MENPVNPETPTPKKPSTLVKEPQNQPDRTQPDRLYLIPDELFIRDAESESNAPELIRGTPQYKFENFLALLPLAKRLGEIKRNKALEKLGFGFGGFVFQFKSGEKDMAVKLVFSKEFTEDVLNQVLDVVEVHKEDRDRVLETYKHQQSNDNCTLNEAGGFELGHVIAPDYIDKPECIFTFNGIPIAFAVPTLYGEGTDIGEGKRKVTDPNIDQAMKRLRNGGVGVDIIGDNNAIKYQDGGAEKVKIVDVIVGDTTLNHDPRILRPGEYRVRRLQKGEKTFIKGVWATHRILSDRIATFNNQHREVIDGGKSYTFEDQLAGIVQTDDIVHFQDYQRTSRKLLELINLMQRYGVDVDAEESYFMVNETNVNYSRNAWFREGEIEDALSNNSPLISHELSASYTPEGIGEKSFSFLERVYTTAQSYKQLEARYKDGMLTFVTSSVGIADESTKMLQVNTINSECQYSEGNPSTKPVWRKIDPSSQEAVLTSFKTTFNSTNILDPQIVLASAMSRLSSR